MRSPKSFSREQVLFAAVLTIVPILLCGFMFGFDIPLASADFWRTPKNDMLAMTGAYEAYVRQPWTFPLTMVSGLSPKPFSIVFSDSIPWLAILLKASGLGPSFNPLGVFLMLSYPLQAWGMVALLRSLGVQDRVTLAIGGLMALLFPTWIARQFGHIALCGHWLILFSLALAVSSARLGLTWKRVGGFAALAALATGIHAYHLVPIGACFGAALLAELLQRREGAWTRVLAGGVAVLASVGVPAFILGYGGGDGAAGGADALGVYSMNVLAPVWPQASNVFGQHWNGGWFEGTMAPTGQYFEGFQFMGVGVVLLVALALGLKVRSVRQAPVVEREAWARWTPLALAMLFLTIWAIGWVVYAGYWHLFDVPKPKGKVADLISTFRGHGRFFWAPGYLILALAIRQVSLMRRPVAVAVLAGALLLQAYDTSPLRQGVRAIFAAPDALMVPAGLLSDPAVRDRPWVFRPTYFCTVNAADLQVISQMVLVATRTGGTANTFAMARNNDPLPCDVVDPELTRDAAPGDRRMTIVLADDKLEGGFLQPVGQRTDCYRFERGVICGRDLEGVEGLTPVAPGELTASRTPFQTIRLDQPPKSPALLSGWSTLDPGGKGIWTTAHKAAFKLDVPADIGAKGFLIDVVAIGFSDLPLRPQRVTLYAEGRAVGAREVETSTFGSHRFVVPADVARPGETMTFTFDLPDARTSRADPRMLGIAVQEIRASR
ncbi:hypothetical protein B7G68_04860 [Caulobacter segnis]|uniref:DUF6311 domain-containing protein n=2 Tax=Caulobacter segnis TaxID=88688 RepID=D5VF36_CAUST|nr:DUF6311 domain-containing protein [Caulobacter segnis]ADG09454.1 hypothetical protein Cseg_0949 [Caulobacter segnis ATCC 21756]AVQ01250.1 hypothetical protein B7G68_04860 [Caulobacter segnis]